MSHNLSAEVPFLRSRDDRSAEPARLPNLAFPEPEAAGRAMRDTQFPIFEMVLGRPNFPGPHTAVP